MDEKQILAPCGINCRLCLANQRKKNRCDGCYAEYGVRAKHCETCKIKLCEGHGGKQTPLCIECEKFPCKRMKHIDARYIKGYGVSLIQNQEKYKNLGAEAFIEEEKRIWICGTCGESLCIHREVCQKCGAPNVHHPKAKKTTRRPVMEWCELYRDGMEPSLSDIEDYIGGGAVLWKTLRERLENAYKVEPKLSYSKCSAQPGWNVKYQKSGKSLCTLYPMEEYFISLVVIGKKEEPEVELVKSELSPYSEELYNNTRFSCGGRWLMVKVDSEAVMEDVLKLISVRVKSKK